MTPDGLQPDDDGPADDRAARNVSASTGDVVLTPSASSRIIGLGGGILAALVGLVVLVVGPGDLADSLLARAVFGGVLLLGGGLAAVRSRSSLTLDGVGVHVQRGWSSTLVVWDEVTRLELEERFDARARAFGGSTGSVGPIRVRTGAGSRRGQGAGIGSRRSTRTLLVTIDGEDGATQAALAGVTLEETAGRVRSAVTGFAPHVEVVADGS